MTPLWYALLGVFAVSLISFSGALALFLRKALLQRILAYLVAFAAGGMLGAAFLDLLPESLEVAGESMFWYALIGIIAFFVLEKYLFWHHCHGGECEHTHHKHTIKPVAYLNLIGDGLHNFLDGVIIAVSFLQSVELGIIVTFAVMLHEIPQELGDFGVLIHAGLKPAKALLMNFLTALTAVLGAIAGYFFTTSTEGAAVFLLPFAAGNFIYIAATDLLPSIHHETKFWKSMQQVFVFLCGIGLMWLMTSLMHAH